jgi:TetR/AcrR family transcriptional regulator, regulator of mycofactocin system
MAAAEGLRARKKRQTAQRIESAALELFERDGFDATTIDAIAAAADIAPRTFFHYYPTKEDVVLADYARRLNRVTVELEAQPLDKSPWSALGAALQVVAADFESEREQLIARFQFMAATASVARRALQLQADCETALTTVLTQRISETQTRADYTPRLHASAALAAMRTSHMHWLSTGFDQRLPTILQQCFADMANGLEQDR